MRILAGSKNKLDVDPCSYGDLLAAYVNELRVRNYGDSSREQAGHVLPRFFAYLMERRVSDIRAVTEEHVVAWAKHISAAQNRHGEPLSPHTRRSYLVLLQRFFRYLVRRGLVLADPMLDVTMPQVSKLPRVVLSHSQARRLIEAPSPWTPVGKRDRALLELLYGTGLRVSECARLELRDVDLGKGTLFVRQGKGKKDRVVPFAGQAAAALDLYLREGRPAFARGARQQALFLSSSSGRPIQSTTIQLIVREHAREAGLKVKVTPHCLRHTYATHLIQGGASVRHVQKLLGHRLAPVHDDLHARLPEGPGPGRREGSPARAGARTATATEAVELGATDAGPGRGRALVVTAAASGDPLPCVGELARTRLWEQSLHRA